MAPEGSSEPHRNDGSTRSGPSGPDTSAAEAALKARLSRKRTKTGCLTCRKRRIKCGEERPVCKNCIKSKRHCEGYNQRVVFKPPTFDYQPAPHGGAHIVFQVPPPPGQNPPQQDPNAPFIDASVYGQLRPRPDSQQYMPVFGAQPQPFVQAGAPQHASPHSVPTTPNEHPQVFQFAPALPILPVQGYQFPPPPQQQPFPAQNMQHVTPVMMPASGPIQHPLTVNTGQYEPDAQVGAMRMPPVTMPSEYLVQAYGQSVPYASQHFTTEATPLSGQMPPHDTVWPDAKPAMPMSEGSAAPTPASSRSSHTLPFSQTPIVSSQPWTPSTYVPRPELARPIDHQHNMQSASAAWLDHVEGGDALSQRMNRATPEYYEHEAHVITSVTTTNTLTEAAVETQDDDYFDVESDEIETDEEEATDASAAKLDGHTRHQKLSRILAMTQTSVDEMHVRRYDTFLQPGILEHYHVEESASPLRNPATARVFAHFISVTGPSLSIFERHPRNTSIVFTEGSIPLSQQGLWTYRMPMAALRNQGLLHAMLALASLHIARLQNASITPSMQHYAWALRRIHGSVGKPNSRLKVSTIAASMLLGFYEVMTADHVKWNLHLAGSRQLFVETDFVRMTREFRRLKRARAERLPRNKKRRNSAEDLFSQDELLDQIPDVDEDIISRLTGRVVRYDEHSGIESASIGIPPGLDLSKFEILKDLYWWYCKQDVYQSIVSGNPLLMDFGRWADCPPRAPLGKAEAVYGSFDHLVLLLGRIAEFAANDRKRKLRQMEANGGQWIPASGMNIQQPPQPHVAPNTPISATNRLSQPVGFGPPQLSPAATTPAPFYGMAPPPRTSGQMPAAYAPAPGLTTPQSARPPEAFEDNLQQQTDTAMVEYGRIRAALHEFSSSLGEAFMPLSPEYQVPMETAFGTTRFYRSYDIGCLWAVYNMAMIITIRSHPNMPPAAHHAAAIASHETASYAQEIGRIAAGIVPGPPNQPLNPGLGAALCESCMPSFHAAIQYSDPQQRHETVERIWSIAKRTGWGSAELIANGCETAWVKAAAAGRGPPYERRKRQPESEDPRMNGSWERLDASGTPDERDDSDRRLVRTRAGARLTWAWGVLGVEEDVGRVSLDDRQ